MVFFAITLQGYESYRSLAWAHGVGALWVAGGVLVDADLAALRAAGVVVSQFNEAIDLLDTESIACAVETIKEHHPGQVVWVEG